MTKLSLTARLLADTFADMMEKVPFAKITVADLCDACGVNRKSFYYHFTDKYDLMNKVFYKNCGEGLEEEADADFWVFFGKLAGCMGQNRRFYLNAFTSEGENAFEPYLRDYLARNLARYTRHFFATKGREEAKRRECLDFLGATFVTSLRMWLEEYPDLTVEEFMEVTKFDKLLQ